MAQPTPTPEENPPLLRRPVIFVPPQIPEAWSQSFAVAVGEISGTPDLVNSLKSRYEATGNLPEFQAFEDNFYRARDEEAAANVVVRMKERAKELGLDDGTLVQLDAEEKLSALKTEGEALLMRTKQALPEGYISALADPKAAQEDENQDAHDVGMLEFISNNAQSYAQRTNQWQKELEADYQANFLEGDRAKPNSIPGTISEFLFQIGTTFLPGTDIAEARYMAKAFGINYGEDGELISWNKNLNVGQVRADMRKLILNASPEQKKVYWDIFKKAAPEMLSDLSARSLAEFVFNPNAGPPPDEELDYMLNAVLPWVDTVFALGGAKAAGSWGIQSISRTASPALRTAIVTNKVRTRQLVAAAVEEAQRAVDPITKSKTYSKWGLSEAQVGVSQVPKEANLLDQVADFPDGLADEVARIRKIQEDLSAVVVRSSNIDIGDVNIQQVIDREAGAIEETFGGALRPGLSTIKVKSDKSGLDFGLVIGKNETTGFPNELEAYTKAEDFIRNGERVQILESDGTKISPILTGKEALEELDAIRAGRVPRNGSFFVKVNKEYNYRPVDRMLFGEDPVVAPTWMGRASNYLLHPINRFSEEVAGGYLKNYLLEQSTKAYLGRIVAPIRAMSSGTQRRINDMYEWSYTFGRQRGTEPTVQDLMDNFDYAATSEEIRGFYLMKQFYKTSHEIQNRRLYRDWSARGYKTVRARNGQGGNYHGLPIARERVKDGITVYDPEIQAIRSLESAEIEALYKDGGTILRSDLAMRGPKSRKNHSYNILVRGGDKAPYQLVPLTQNPLRYIPGYWPRMYKDNYYIRRQVTDAIVDGKNDPNFSQVVAVAGTKKEAEDFVRYANGRSKKGAVYSIQEDSRLSINDSIANDLEFLRTEGRLFFDTRKPHLRDVHGVRAEIYDPVNMLSRATGAISRQIAVEDLVKGLKTAWAGKYGKLITGDVERTKTSAIALELDQNLTTIGGKEYNDALLSWQYIQVMEGSVNTGNQWFRKAAIASSEWLGTLLKKTGPGATHPANWLIRNGGNLSPVEGLKNFAFHYFITMRPLRQLVVQSAQHLFLAALDPTYGLGRLQKDIPLLIMGLQKKARGQVMTPKQGAFLEKTNAKLLGYDSKEYDKLVTEFDRSGLVQTIDVHSIAGTSLSSVDDLPMSMAGDVFQKTKDAITLKPLRDRFRQWGFETGETANLAGSYLVALRMFRNENPSIKSLLDITEEQWQKIGTRASNYALSMNRAGAANYQYSTLSLPLQFLQYSHKTMLVGAKAVLGPKLASSFTTSEAQKMMAAQVILFGGAGFGIKEYVSGWLGKSGFTELQGTEVEDVLAGGILDWTLDNALQSISGDPDLNLAFDSLLAPGGSVAQTGRQFWEAAMEQPIYQALAGPATEAGGQVMKFVQLAQTMRGEGITDEQALKEGLLLYAAAAYGGAWANDLWKARLAQKTGFWVSNNGQMSGIEAQWEAIIAKGMLGLNSQNVIDNYNLLEDSQKYKDDLDNIAKEYSSRVNQISLAFHEAPYSYSDYVKRLEQAAAGFKGGLEPEEWQYVLTQFYADQQRLKTQRNSALDMVSQDLSYGVPADEALLAKLRASQLLKENPRREDFLRLTEKALEEANEQARQPIDIFGRDKANLAETNRLLQERDNPND